MREIEHRRMKYDTAKTRRVRLITWTAIALAIVLALPWTLGLFSPRVYAKDLLETVQTRPVEGKPVDETFQTVQTDFAVKLLQGCYNRRSILVSPLSLTVALSMAANGATGETLAQMEQVVCGGMDIATWNEYLYSYVNQLPDDPRASFSMGNSLWYDTEADLDIQKPFLETIASYYDANVYAEVFDEATLQAMNAWAERETKGMIKNPVQQLDQVMYVLNALAFEGKWDVPYEDDQVREDWLFTQLNGVHQTVTMLSSDEEWYLQSDNATGFMKDYQGGNYRFVAILPNQELTLNQYLDQLTGQELRDMMDGAIQCTVETMMPEFTLSCDLDMTSVLQDMGMTTVFNPMQADLTPMAICQKDHENLYIAGVGQQTYISVDANGTKAAAITIFSYGIGTTVAPPENPVVILDRPFLYLIVDTQTNLPIFIGAVTSI